MIIIGCDYHPGFQQIAFVDMKLEIVESSDCNTARKRKSFTVIWRGRESRCVWGWKPVGMRAGSRDCWRS